MLPNLSDLNFDLIIINLKCMRWKYTHIMTSIKPPSILKLRLDQLLRYMYSRKVLPVVSTKLTRRRLKQESNDNKNVYFSKMNTFKMNTSKLISDAANRTYQIRLNLYANNRLRRTTLYTRQREVSDKNVHKILSFPIILLY